MQDNRCEVLTATPTVLVVDDDRRILQLVCEMARFLGYNTISCTGSQGAIEIFEDQNCQVDVLLCDVDMPGMTGLELIQHLSARIPGLPIVLMTGHAENLMELHNVLEKPFDIVALRQRLAKALRHSNAPHSSTGLKG